MSINPTYDRSIGNGLIFLEVFTLVKLIFRSIPLMNSCNGRFGVDLLISLNLDWFIIEGLCYVYSFTNYMSDCIGFGYVWLGE